MTRDREKVEAVMRQLSPEAVQLLKRVLEIEKESLHVRARAPEITDAILREVKGLIP